jgi:2-methylcitrate dehydratase PrpD
MRNLHETLAQNGFMTTALNSFPVCRLAHVATKVAGHVYGTSTFALGIEEVTIAIKPTMWNAVSVPRPNKIHPQNWVDAHLSIYYQTAVALSDGPNTGWKVYSWMKDQDMHDHLDKITVVRDGSSRGMGTQLTVRWKDSTEKTDMVVGPHGKTENPFSKEKVIASICSRRNPVNGEK